MGMSDFLLHVMCPVCKWVGAVRMSDTLAEIPTRKDGSLCTHSVEPIFTHAKHVPLLCTLSFIERPMVFEEIVDIEHNKIKVTVRWFNEYFATIVSLDAWQRDEIFRNKIKNQLRVLLQSHIWETYEAPT